MRIDLGGGAYMESGEEDARFMRGVAGRRPLGGARCGHLLTLDCGHAVMMFGNIQTLPPLLLCVVCRDEAIFARHEKN